MAFSTAVFYHQSSQRELIRPPETLFNAQYATDVESGNRGNLCRRWPVGLAAHMIHTNGENFEVLELLQERLRIAELIQRKRKVRCYETLLLGAAFPAPNDCRTF